MQKVIATGMCLVILSSVAIAQTYTPDPRVEQEVNEQVWRPFKRAWEARDAEKFNALHTDDVLRVSRWSGIRVGSEYKDRITASYQKTDERKRTIDFWLEHRIYAENVGYEVGYLRVITETPGEERNVSCGRFHIVLRKEEGVWRIAQDWDTNMVNGVEVTIEDFNKGTPLDLD